MWCGCSCCRQCRCRHKSNCSCIYSKHAEGTFRKCENILFEVSKFEVSQKQLRYMCILYKSTSFKIRLENFSQTLNTHQLLLQHINLITYITILFHRTSNAIETIIFCIIQKTPNETTNSQNKRKAQKSRQTQSKRETFPYRAL